MTQVRQDVGLTKGGVIVRGNLVSRGPLAEARTTSASTSPTSGSRSPRAKDNNNGLGDRIQQAFGYAEMLDVPVRLQYER